MSTAGKVRVADGRTERGMHEETGVDHRRRYLPHDRTCKAYWHLLAAPPIGG